MFQWFLSRNVCVVPLRKGIPQVEWSRYYDKLPSQDDAKGWDEVGHKEYALLCGSVSNVVAIDIDTDDTSLFYTLAGETPLRKLGSKGFTAFYRYNGERSQTWGRKEDGSPIVELLSDKRLTTIPPSPHRKTGKPYIWMDGDAGFANLPVINPDFFTFMDAKYPRPKQKAWTPPVEYNEKVQLEDAAEMLNYISSDCSREQWINIGMALRDEYGDAACHLWHDWSARAASRYKHNDAQAAWRSFGGAGVTIGTVVYIAKQGGWVPKPIIDDMYTVDLSYIYELKKSPSSSTPPETIAVQGMVGAIADWITATAIRPQPVLSLAAALVFVGMLKGHRIRGKTNLRTNIMAMSLAPTASGKEHPQQCIDRLAEAVGLGKHIMGRPTSGTGLLTGVHKCGGIALLSVDEMGRFIGNISMKSAGGFQREITDYMVELFSASGRTFRGRQYANEKQNPQIILNQPHFCCLGSTVPERLQAACSGAEIVDGFLNRWLIFSAGERSEKQHGVKFAPPPAQLVDMISYWMAENPTKYDNYGIPEPVEVSILPEAFKMLCEFDAEMIKKLDTEPYPINQLYARSTEHAEKMAMILADDSMIGISEMKNAIAIVNRSNAQLAAFAAGITDGQHEADVVFVLEIIKRWPNITRNQLTQMTRKLNNKIRMDIINQLVESGEVIATIDGKRQTFHVNV